MTAALTISLTLVCGAMSVLAFGGDLFGAGYLAACGLALAVFAIGGEG